MASDRIYGKFTLAIGTKAEGVDAVAYGTVLVNTAALIDEYTNALETGAKFEIAVRAERKGSHLADIILQAGTAVGVTSQYITPDNILLAKAFAGKVISGVAKCWELAKKLQGEPPARIEQHGDAVNIVIKGDVNAPISITVDKSVADTVIKNEHAKIAIANTFQALEGEDDVGRVMLLNQANRELVQVNREDFRPMSKRLATEKVRHKLVRKRAVLAVNRQSFKKSKKSDFIYVGNEITASIEDDAFWKAIDEGERFAKGDRLVVELEIEQTFNGAANVYENSSYKIIKVQEHRPRKYQRYLVDMEPVLVIEKKKPLRLKE